MDITRTPEEHQKLLAQMAQYHPELPKKIQGEVSRLENLLQKFNPIDVIALTAIKHLFGDPETYAEYAHEGLQAQRDRGSGRNHTMLYVQAPLSSMNRPSASTSPRPSPTSSAGA